MDPVTIMALIIGAVTELAKLHAAYERANAGQEPTEDDRRAVDAAEAASRARLAAATGHAAEL